MTEVFLNFKVNEVDLIIASLEYAIGSIGGFCVGSSYVVEHQTLAGLGYCFSASLPPMLAAGALKSVQLLENNPSLTSNLSRKSQIMHDNFDQLPGLELYGDRRSPVKHLRCSGELERSEAKAKLKKLVLEVHFLLPSTILCVFRP